MGAIVALMATGLAISGLYALATKKDTRAEFLREIKDAPLGAVLALMMSFFGLAFFWGVMIPRLGEIPIWVFGHKLHVWSASGIAFVVALGLLLFTSRNK